MMTDKDIGRNQIEEVESEESVLLSGTDAIKKSLQSGHILLDELKAFSNTDIGMLFNDELNSEYQRVFREATTTDDANKAKASLDRMKGLGFAMGIIGNLIKNLEDDLENLRENLEYQQAVEETK